MTEKPPLLFRRTLRGFAPADQRAADAMRKVAVGGVVSLDIRQPRNLKHHRKWWALCHLIAENAEGMTPSLVCEVLKVRSGHVTVVRTKKGEVHIPKSISFAAMDQRAFDEFWDGAVRVVLEDVLPGVASEDLEREVLEMLGSGV